MTTEEAPLPDAEDRPSDDLPAPAGTDPLGDGSSIYLQLVEEHGDPFG